MNPLEDLAIGLLGSGIAFLPLYFANRALDDYFQKRGARARPTSIKLLLPVEVNEFVGLADDYRLRTGHNAIMMGLGFGATLVSLMIVVKEAWPNGGSVPVWQLFDFMLGNTMVFVGYLGLRRAHRQYVAAVEQVAR
jgi:hypothetical protein